MKGSNSILRKQFENQFPKLDNSKLQDVIDQFIDYKINCYNNFLITKLDLQQLKHRKIVHKICIKYIPQQKLQSDCSNLISTEVGGTKDFNLKYLIDSMKQLPNLQNLSLNLSNYKVGKMENLIFLATIMKQVPRLSNLNLKIYYKDYQRNFEYLMYLEDCIILLPNLKYFTLDLSNSELGQYSQNMKNIQIALSKLPNNLKYLKLILRDAYLGQIENNIQHLENTLKQLPRNLQDLELYLQYNYLENSQSMKYIANGLKQLPKSLKNLELLLYGNEFGENIQSMKFLVEGLQNLTNLNNLYLDLSEIQLGNNSEINELLGKSLQQLPINLQYLTLDLSSNHLGHNMEIWKYLANGIKNLPNNLIHFKLSLYNNLLSINIQGLSLLGEGIAQLQNLEYLELNLMQNDLGRSGEDFDSLAALMENIPENLLHFNLDLSLNQFGLYYDMVESLEDCLMRIPVYLNHLELSFKNNYLDEHRYYTNDQAEDYLNQNSIQELYNKLEEYFEKIDIYFP